MRKAFVVVLVSMLITAVFTLWIPSAESYSGRRFGRFVVIDEEQYKEKSGHSITQYRVYDKDTHIVYIYSTDDAFTLAITPYMMLNVYGNMTVGIYNTGAGYIEPAEPYLDENGEEWVEAG